MGGQWRLRTSIRGWNQRSWVLKMRSWGSPTFQITQNSGPPLLSICTFSKKLGARIWYLWGVSLQESNDDSESAFFWDTLYLEHQGEDERGWAYAEEPVEEEVATNFSWYAEICLFALNRTSLRKKFDFTQESLQPADSLDMETLSSGSNKVRSLLQFASTYFVYCIMYNLKNKIWQAYSCSHS